MWQFIYYDIWSNGAIFLYYICSIDRIRLLRRRDHLSNMLVFLKLEWMLLEVLAHNGSSFCGVVAAEIEG